MEVRKADGRIEEFSISKIETVLEKVNNEAEDTNCEFMDIGELQSVVDEVEDYFEDSFEGTVDTIFIKDYLIKVLREHEFSDIATLFSKEWNRRKKSREEDTISMKSIGEIITGASRVSKENANIKSNTSMGAMLRVGSESTKLYALLMLYTKIIADAHLHGDIHIHDLDFSMFTSTCDQVPADKILMNGLKSKGDNLRCAGDIRSACNIMAVVLQANQNEQYGGQSIPMFDYYLAPFISKTYYKAIVMICILIGVFGVTEDNKFSILKNFKKLWKEKNYHLIECDSKELFECIKEVTSVKYSKSRFEDITNKALEYTVNESMKAMHAFISNMNTLHSRAGAQVPFSSINYGTDTSEEGRMVIRCILKATYEGIGGIRNDEGKIEDGITPIFPIQIFKMKAGVNVNKEDRNYDLFKLAEKVSAKRMFPNWCNLDAPYNKSLIVEGRPETEMAYMGCRTRIAQNIHDSRYSVIPGRGNIAFISINLPRLGIRAHGDKKLFFKLLDEELELVHEALQQRMKILIRLRKAGDFPFMYMQHMWVGTDNVKETDSIEEFLKNGTFAIGFIGLAETLVALTGKHHGQSVQSNKLGMKIIKHMRDYTDAISEYEKLNYSVIATPAEGLSNRFTMLDRKRFGNIPGVTDKEYYTNSSHIPVDFKISAFDKIRIEAPYHELENGGHILYIEFDGDPEINDRAYDKIVMQMYKSNAGYFAINRPIDFDPVCGYEGIINDICPRCGRKEFEALGNDEYNKLKER